MSEPTSQASARNGPAEGWYIRNYLLRLREVDDTNEDDPEARFLAW